MRVSTYDGHTRQRQSLLRTYNVYYTVVLCSHCKMLNTKLLTVCLKSLYLLTSYGIVYALLLIRWSIMIRHSIDVTWTKNFQSFVTQRIKSLRCCHLMTIQTIYIQLCGTILYRLHHMSVPYFIKECVHNVYNLATLNLFIQSIYASTVAVTISVLEPKP